MMQEPRFLKLGNAVDTLLVRLYFTCAVDDKKQNKIHFWIFLSVVYHGIRLDFYSESKSGDVINGSPHHESHIHYILCLTISRKRVLCTILHSENPDSPDVIENNFNNLR